MSSNSKSRDRRVGYREHTGAKFIGGRTAKIIKEKAKSSGPLNSLFASNLGTVWYRSTGHFSKKSSAVLQLPGTFLPPRRSSALSRLGATSAARGKVQ